MQPQARSPRASRPAPRRAGEPRSAGRASWRSLAIWLLHLAVIALAETAARSAPSVGLLLYATLLVTTITGAARIWQGRRLALAVGTVALVRVLGMALGAVGVGGAAGHIFTAVPAVIAVAIAADRAGYRLLDIGLTLDRRQAALCLPAIPMGLIAGIALTGVVTAPPAPLGPRDPVIPIEGFAVSLVAAFVDGVILRGLVQRAAIERFGISAGIGFAAVLSTILGAAPWAPAGVVFVFAISIVLSAVTHLTRSIAPSVAGHAGLIAGLTLLASAPS